jgi:hypothetical protein
MPQVKLTEEQKQAYIQGRSGGCPYCKSNNIEGDSYEMHGNCVSQPISCLDCERQWEDVYTLTGIDETEETNGDGHSLVHRPVPVGWIVYLLPHKTTCS